MRASGLNVISSSSAGPKVGGKLDSFYTNKSHQSNTTAISRKLTKSPSIAGIASSNNNDNRNGSHHKSNSNCYVDTDVNVESLGSQIFRSVSQPVNVTRPLTSRPPQPVSLSPSNAPIEDKRLDESRNRSDSDSDEFEYEGPSDPGTMRAIIRDLNIRLKNAKHAITSQSLIAAAALEECSKYRSEASRLTLETRLHKHRHASLLRRHTQLKERQQLQEKTALADKLQYDLRLLSVDQQMSRSQTKRKEAQAVRDELAALKEQLLSHGSLLRRLTAEDEAVESLCSSCEAGDLVAVASSLEAGVCVNDVDGAGFLPIHYACRGGSPEILRLLLQNGSDCSCFLSGKNPMEVAAKYGHVALLRILVQYGGDVDEAGTGSPPLFAAVSSNSFECVQELLSMGADATVTDCIGRNAIHIAAVHVSSERSEASCGGTSDDSGEIYRYIEVLISHGADVEHRDINGLTPLQCALTEGKVEAVRALKALNLKREH